MSDPSPVPSSAGISDFRRKIGRALVQVLVVVIVIGILDVLAAEVCRSQCEFLFRLEHRKKYRVKDAVYHHGLTPNVSVMGRWGDSYYPFYVNSLGFRDGAVRNIPLKGQGPRLLFIGDSFTEGQGIAFEKTFVGRVATELKKDGVEVLNAAVSSYAPTVYYAKLRNLIETKGLEVSHVAVFIVRHGCCVAVLIGDADEVVTCIVRFGDDASGGIDDFCQNTKVVKCKAPLPITTGWHIGTTPLQTCMVAWAERVGTVALTPAMLVASADFPQHS